MSEGGHEHIVGPIRKALTVALQERDDLEDRIQILESKVKVLEHLKNQNAK